MRRNFLCYDKNGYIRSILHINRPNPETCEATIYVAANQTKYLPHVKWVLLKVDNEKENSIVENSLFIKPFFSIVEVKYYNGTNLFPFQLYYDSLSQSILCKKFEEEGNTIKEYNSKKYAHGLPPVHEMSPTQLKLPL